MDKNLIKKFALSAKNTLLNETGNDEAAVRRFIKICARRFMEVNGYLPENLTEEDGIAEQIMSIIPEEDWRDNVQILGWLYQYYNSEKKDEIFADLKKNVKISKENIPAATQLFTPDWIVKYMTENSLGKLWAESHPEFSGRENWEYYIEEQDQCADTKKQLEEIRAEHGKLKPEDIRCIDPCCGSGNILVSLFDILMQIYISQGYAAEDAVRLIIKNNIYGLDIDENVVRIAKFSIMMKARQYDENILSDSNVKPNIFCIKNSNDIGKDDIKAICSGDKELEEKLLYLTSAMKDADEYGSLLKITNYDAGYIKDRLAVLDGDDTENEDIKTLISKLRYLAETAEVLSGKYHVVVTNPPYMGKKSFNKCLKSYMEEHYKNGKADLYSAYIKRCSDLTEENGYTAMITMQTWMFISTFKDLRKEVIDNETLISMLHTGAGTFEELNAFNVLAAAFVRQKSRIDHYKGTCVKLTEYNSGEEKSEHIYDPENTYRIDQSGFNCIDENQFIYWIPDNVYDLFQNCAKIKDYGKLTNGMFTCDNERFVRYWYELPKEKIAFNIGSEEEAELSHKEWFPYIKGGKYRKWYGNNRYVVYYPENGKDIREYREERKQSKTLPGENYFFKPGITWSPFGFENFSVRYKEQGYIFDIAGSSLFVDDKENELYILAFLASSVGFYLLSAIAPTVNYQIGNIGDLPLIIDEKYKQEIIRLAKENIMLSKEEWDDYELSWDFESHPLARGNHKLVEEAFEEWKEYAEKRYEKLKENEEKINDYFIKIYHMENCVSNQVNERDIALRKADLQEDIRSLVSYCIGCLFGRYTHEKISADKTEKVLVLNDKHIFCEDIYKKFSDVVACIYGRENLTENLQYIARVIGKSKDYVKSLKNYFIKTFFKDHVKQYRKCPIYWMFGNKSTDHFKMLVYIHAFKENTLKYLLENYLNKQEAFCEAEMRKYKEIFENEKRQSIRKDASYESMIVTWLLHEVQDYKRDVISAMERGCTAVCKGEIFEEYKQIYCRRLLAKIHKTYEEKCNR